MSALNICRRLKHTSKGETFVKVLAWGGVAYISLWVWTVSEPPPPLRFLQSTRTSAGGRGRVPSHLIGPLLGGSFRVMITKERRV